MTKTSEIAGTILIGVTIVSVLAATVTLAWHGTLNGEAAAGVIATILAGVLGVGAHATGVRAGSQATVDPPPDV